MRSMNCKGFKRVLVYFLALTMVFSCMDWSILSVYAADEDQPAAQEEQLQEPSGQGEDQAASEEPAAEKAAPEKQKAEKQASDKDAGAPADADKEEPVEAEDSGAGQGAAAELPAFRQTVEQDGVAVTVTAEEGIFPEDATLSVKTVSKKEEKAATAAVDKVRDTDRNIAASYTFDIKILDADGDELQPPEGKNVYVSFQTSEVKEELLTPEVYHIDDSNAKPEAELLKSKDKGDIVTAETEGFSTFQVNFTYDGITYSLPANTNSVTLDQILDKVGITGRVFRVKTDPETGSHLTVTGPENNSDPGNEASLYTITPDESFTSEQLIVYLAQDRPTYYIDVAKEGVTSSSQILLRHRDGNLVKDSNNIRRGEVFEVYVTGPYSEAQRAGFTYTIEITGFTTADDEVYKKNPWTKPSNGHTNILYTDEDLTQIGDRGSNTTRNFTFTTSNTQTNVGNLKKSGTGYRWLVCNDISNAKSRLKSMTLEVTVKDGSRTVASCTGSNALALTIVDADLGRDLNDVARSLHPVVVHAGDTQGKDLKEIIGNAGIAHFTCDRVSVTPQDASLYDNLTFEGDTTIAKSDGFGYERVLYDVNTYVGSRCQFHSSSTSGTISVDVYVLRQVNATLDGNKLTVSNLNPWCKYQIIDTTTGQPVGDEYRYPTLADPNADDKDKQLADDGETLVIPGLTVGHTYKIVELFDVNFASVADSQPKTVQIDNQDTATVDHTSFTDLDNTTKPVIKNGSTVVGNNDSPVVGDTLTASTGADDCTFEWFYADEEGNPTGSAIGTGATREVTAADVGKKFVVVATQAQDADGNTLSPARTQASNPTGAVVKKENTDPTPDTPTVDPGDEPGTITVSEPTGSKYEYGYRIKGSSDDYTTTDSAEITGLKKGVTYEIVVREKETGDTEAGAWSSPAAEVTAPAEVTLTGTAVVTKTLTVTTNADDAAKPLTYEWYTVEGSTATKIDGADDDSYTLTASEVGKSVKVVVKNAAGNVIGEVTSDVVSAHTHNYGYTAAGATITAECQDTDCPDTDKGKKELTMTATNVAYGTAPSITLDGKDAFNTATGQDVKASDIKYFDGEGNEYTGDLDKMPAGSYTAKLTVGGATAEVGFAVTRAQAATPTEDQKPEIAAGGHDTIKVTNPVEGLRYTLLDEDGVPVQGVDQIIAGTETELVFEGLDPNTTYKVGVTTPEDSNHTESDPLVSDTATTNKAPQAEPGAPNATADAKDTISISGAGNGMKYVFTPAGGGDPVTVTISADGTEVAVQPNDGSVTPTVENGTLTVVGFTPDTVYNVTAVRPEDATHQESPESKATPVKTAKDAPGATAGAKEGEAGNDGSITNVDDTMEYSVDGGEHWIAVPQGATEITGLKAGDYLVHYKAVPGDNQPSSASTLVKVGKKASDQSFDASAKITAETTTNKITVTAPVTSAEDPTVYQYRIDGGEWQTSPVFDDRAPGTTYIVEARKAETATSMPSDPIEANVTTKPEEPTVTTTATSLTISNPENSTLYTVKDGDGNVVAEVKKDKNGEITTVSTATGIEVEVKAGDIVVKGLEQGKEYTVTASKLDDNDAPIPGAESDPLEVNTKDHQHNWTYAYTGGPSVTAACTGEGTCNITEVVLTVKSEKASYTFGDEISITVKNKNDFIDTGATVGAVEYYDANGDKLDSAPTHVGTYTAKVKVTTTSDVYPFVEFSIKPKAEDTPAESLKPAAEKAGYDKVKVNNPEPGYTYEIKDKDGNVVGTATVKSDGTVDASPAGCASMEEGKLVFSGLEPNSKYTVDVYKKASDSDHADSPRLTSNEVTTDKQPETAPANAPAAAATSENTAEIANVDTGNKYILKNGDNEIVITFDDQGNPSATPSGITVALENGKLTVGGLTPNTEYSVTAIKQPTDENHSASGPSPAATIKTAKEAPTGVEQDKLVGAAGNDGSIKGVTSDMQYKDPETGSWVDITGTEITGLKPGNYEIRYKADGDQPASESTTIEVKSKTPNTDAVDQSAITTTTETQKITVTAPVTSAQDTTVYEYSLDGVNWQTTTEFTQIKVGNEMKDLEPGTTYPLHVRKAETDTQMATTPTTVNVTTKPSAPDESKIETTATTLTIHDPEDSTKYEVKDEGGNVVATVKLDSAGNVIGNLPENVTIEDNGDITVTGLKQDKTYTVVATKINDNGTDISNPSDGTPIKTDKHKHAWEYSLEHDDTFKATCTGEGTCDYQASGSKPLVVELIANDTTYDGSAYAASVDKKNGIDSVSGCIESIGEISYYEGEYQSGKTPLAEPPKAKGDYTAVVTVTAKVDGVDTPYTLKKSFSITKNGNNAFPDGAAPAIEGWTYGDTAKAPTIADDKKPAHGTVKFVYSDSETGNFTETVPTTAGTWYVKAIVEDSADYNACESGVTSFSIAPKQINERDLQWTGGELTYTGNAQTVSASVKDTALVGEDVVNVTVSCEPQTTVGSYTAKATGLSNPNYVLAAAAKEDHDWSIAKATDNGFPEGAKPTIEGWTYGSAANDPSGPQAKYGNDTIHYVYCKANADGTPNGDYTSTVPTDAGDWLVKAVIDDCADYSGAESEPQKFTIAKKKVTLTWPENPTYDGTKKEMIPDVTGLLEGDAGKVSPVMGGAYFTVSVSAIDLNAKVAGLEGDRADNYEIDPDAETTHTWNLNKGEVEPPTGVSSKPDSKVEGVDNGSITGLDTTKPMQYRAKKSDGTWGDWIDVPEGAATVENLKDGDYQVRYAETSNTKPSEPITVTVNAKGDQTPPTANPQTSADTTSITVNPTIPGAEYIVVPKGTKPEDYDWSESKLSEQGEAITFDKLTPGTEYEVVYRIAEDENNDASEPSAPKAVTTTPNTPDADKIATTPTTLTISDPEENTQYKVYDEDNNVIATVNVDKDGKILGTPATAEDVTVEMDETGNIIVRGLTPESEYSVTATKIDENGTPTSNESAKSDPAEETPALIPEETPAKPEAAAQSNGTVEVTPTNGTKYVITDEDNQEIATIEVDAEGNVTGVNPEGSGITAEIKDGKLVVGGLEPDTEYGISAIKTPTSPDNKDSEASKPTKFKTAKEAPTSPAQDKLVGEAGNDGSIKGVDETMEYKDPETGEWKEITGDDIKNLPPGDYEVRFKAVPASEDGKTPAQPASESVTVKVDKKANDQTPVKDVTATTTPTKITVTKPVNSGSGGTEYEYSIDGGKTWQKSPTFTKDGNGNALKPGTKYTIMVRKAETADSMPSEPMKITVQTADNAPKGMLLTEAKAKGKNSLAITWMKVQNVDGYDIFMAKCNTKAKTYKCKKVKTVKGNKTFKWTKKGLKKKTAYKIYTRAFKMVNGKKKYVKKSPLIHVYTTGYSAKYTNAKKVSVNKKNVTLEKGMTFKVKAKITKVKKGKKLITEKHAPKFRYYTSNKKVATVSKGGKIKAVAKGIAKIYVMTVDGAMKTITVTVK